MTDNLCEFCKCRHCGGISCKDCKAYSDSIYGCLCRHYAGKITVCPYFQEREVIEIGTLQTSERRTQNDRRL